MTTILDRALPYPRRHRVSTAPDGLLVQTIGGSGRHSLVLGSLGLGVRRPLAIGEVQERSFAESVDSFLGSAPEILTVGELRGGAAADALRAGSTGRACVMTICASEPPRELPERLTPREMYRKKTGR